MAVKKAGAIVSGRTYLIVNKKSGKALSAESGADNGGVVEQFFPDPRSQSALDRRRGRKGHLEAGMQGFRQVPGRHQRRRSGWRMGSPVGLCWRRKPSSGKLEAVKDGYFKIVNAKSGKCLDVVNMSEDDGAAIQIWENVEADNQEWKFEAYPPVEEAPAAKAPAKKETAAKAKAPAKSRAAAKKETAPVKEEAPAVKEAAPVKEEAPAAPAVKEEAPAKKPAAKKPAAKKTAAKAPAKTAAKKPAAKKTATTRKSTAKTTQKRNKKDALILLG